MGNILPNIFGDSINQVFQFVRKIILMVVACITVILTIFMGYFLPETVFGYPRQEVIQLVPEMSIVGENLPLPRRRHF